MEDIIVPLGVFTMTGFIVHFAVNGKVKRKKMEHDERMPLLKRVWIFHCHLRQNSVKIVTTTLICGLLF